MSTSKTSFLEAVTDLAKEHNVVAFVIAAVTPTEDGFALSAGAASRLDENAPENDEVMQAMEDSIASAIVKLRTGMVGGGYLN